jgi:Tfp pilus assembly protein PilO
MVKEEATQAKMWETIDKIHDKVTKNKTDNVSKIEFRFIIWILITMAVSVLSYISYQITIHDEYDEQKIQTIEETMKKLHMK